MSVTLCLSGDLLLKFSRFMSTKQSWIWSTCKVVPSSVKGCGFQCSLTLWPHRWTQLSCPAIYAEQQLLVDWSFDHNAMHMICCQRAQRPFSTSCQQLVWSISDSSSRHSDPPGSQVVAGSLYIAQRVWELGASEGELCILSPELQAAFVMSDMF